MALFEMKVLVRRNKIPRLIATLPGIARTSETETAQEILTTMQGLTPYDEDHNFARYPEHLRDSEHLEPHPEGAQLVVGNDYGYYVNYGTRHMAAQPFFETAIELHKHGLLQRVLTKIETVVVAP